MNRSRSDPGKRVKTAKGRKASSVRWLQRQLNDPYVQQAKGDGYRSRAAYKLIELDEKFTLLRGAKRVVDLGVAPGGWTQVVRRRVPAAAVATKNTGCFATNARCSGVSAGKNSAMRPRLSVASRSTRLSAARAGPDVRPAGR